MHRSSLERVLFALAVPALIAVAPIASAQSITTSAIVGTVSDSSGHGVAGATVTVLHEESGTRSTTVSRSNGQFDVSGLRIGGPYTVSVSSKDSAGSSQKDIYVKLDQASEINFTITSEVISMAALTVSETKDTTFSSSSVSNNTHFDALDVALTPTVRRDVQDIANLDSRITLVPNTSTGEFQLSAPGVNYRYNSFLIDGVQANDPFGLNGNGFASLRSPVPLDAIEAMSIDLSPYDVRRSSFTGALINAVTKSGTNKTHGSAYMFYSNENMRAINPLTSQRDTFKERTFGFTVGGAIIPGKLFYFIAYDDYRRDFASPTSQFKPDQTQVDKIVEAAKTKYGYDAGTISSDAASYQKTYLAKIDWNINDLHRLGFTYRRTDGSSPQFADALSGSSISINGTTPSYRTSLSNHWFQQPRINDTFTVKLNSTWTPDFTTEATASYAKYNGSPKNNGSPFPEVTVSGIDGIDLQTGLAAKGTVLLGTERSRQINFLYADMYYGSLAGEYSFGSHKLLFGGDAERDVIDNRFIQYSLGQYTFGSSTVNGVAAWQAGTTTVGSSRQAFLYTDATQSYSLQEAYADWNLNNLGVFIQDNWRATSQLSLNFGVRMDYPYTGISPKTNPTFGAAGFTYEGKNITTNSTTNSGNYTVGPRFGFNYKFDTARKTQLRGGMGIFQGRNPAVWLSNAYSNLGAVGSVSKTATTAAPVVFTPTTSIQTGKASQNVNVTDPDFKQPVSWKGNLSLDHQLPFWNLTATMGADVQYVIKAPMVAHLNLGTPSSGQTVLPDGRIRYGSTRTTAKAAFGDVIYMTDTTKGFSESFTAGIKRPMKDNWSFSASYTRSVSEDVNPMTSSVAFSNYSGRTTFNPNENVASTSNYNTPYKTVLRVSRKFDFFGGHDASTVFSVAYRGQSGHAYSNVFFNDANGDGLSGNDLLYVPKTDADLNADSKVTWVADSASGRTAQQAHDDFLAYAQQDPELSKLITSGGVVRRNASYNGWQNTIDLHLEQDIPVKGNVKMKLFADLINFGNLLRKSWGVVDGVDFPYTRSVINAGFDTTTNKYTYKFNKVVPDQLFTDLSRWQLQVGARLQF